MRIDLRPGENVLRIRERRDLCTSRRREYQRQQAGLARRAAEVITRDDNRGGIDLLNDKEKTLRKRVAI